jgi:ATP-dependent DNA helicase RecG
VRRAVQDGDVDLLVGTHALLEEDVRFAHLGLVVVDEQHKFGVMQRSALRRKGLAPDLLVMSATPIPRTLTMTLFGDLDISVIDELPPGRRPVTTVLAEEGDRASVYDWVRREIAKGRRAFHVVPLVEDTEELPLRSVAKFAKELAEGPFRGVGVGVLHGKMKSREKDAAMEAFRSGRTPLLVATSVVEVGVDVPEATVLVVEHAERFGLAQLHQLRGRIGRGAFASRAVFFHSAGTEASRARLKALCDTNDGFRIAEEDLRIRGPGEFLGTRQHGLTELQAADLVRDVLLLADARSDAFALVQRDPGLETEGAGIRRALVARFGRRGSSDVS